MLNTQDQELVTVIVPARNEEANIARCIASILEQDWQNLELLVVDGASDDDTAKVVQGIAQRDPRVRLLQNPRKLIPISLNLALAKAQGQWLVRVDAHAEIPPNYVGLAHELLASGHYGAVGGRKDAVGVTPAGRAIAKAMGSRFGVGGSTYHFGTRRRTVEHVPFGCYPVDVLRELGGWDETLAVNQDFELDYRVRASGREILFDPALTIRWQSRQDLRSLYRQYKRYGGGKVIVAMKHPRSLRPRHLASPALILNLLMALLLAPRRPVAATALATPYVLAVSVVSLSEGRSLDPVARAYLPAAFVAMHVGWGLGFWGRVMRVVTDGLGTRGNNMTNSVGTRI